MVGLLVCKGRGGPTNPVPKQRCARESAPTPRYQQMKQLLPSGLATSACANCQTREQGVLHDVHLRVMTERVMAMRNLNLPPITLSDLPDCRLTVDLPLKGQRKHSNATWAPLEGRERAPYVLPAPSARAADGGGGSSISSPRALQSRPAS